ncbi:FAS1 domain-containing protein [Paraphoma chrysanthemicola]|uniref:FAS1 domain-containing protein n=1 Tax=Paraphoma chrysanthemicola TaxID=798071 RepID=A0A8K0W1L7_9PLEO|nr:FAS1 domain-containing protein [Paraphoma chrysanthemicola]
MLCLIFYSLLAAQAARGQNLLEAISKVPALSNFTAFYRNNAAFANALLGNASNYPITFLAPNDQAFASYQERNGISLTSLPPATLLAVLQYHTLVSSLSKENLTGDSGRAGNTIPTMLTTQNNNRSVGISMAARFGGSQRASGQVVFIRSSEPSSNRFLLSRQNGLPQSSIRSGLSSDLSLLALEGDQGIWDGGRFHIVDGLLTPPQLCARTIRSSNLTSLDNALNRTRLWPSLDGSKNVTCLGPSNEAFARAGNPDAGLNETALTDAILFHTLDEVAYSDYLYNGQEFKTLQNGTVRVRVEGQGASRSVWFNNAKLINANVLTHNGLMHVLDAVMMPLEQINGTPSSTPSHSPSATGPSPSATGAANIVQVKYHMLLPVSILAITLYLPMAL